MFSAHLTWSTEGRQTLVSDEAGRRERVRAIARVAGEVVSLFCVVDDHIHVVLYCTDEERRRYSQALSQAFAALPGPRLGPTYVRPVRDRKHLEWLADEYILRQPAAHGVSTNPALWSGSCFADLVGARLLPGLRLRIRDALPRWRLRSAYRAVGLPPAKLEPVSDEGVRKLGAARLVAAAAFAAGADPALSGRTAPEVAARRAAVALGRAAGFGLRELAWAMALTTQATGRIAARAAPDDVVAATRLRLALEEVVVEGAGPEA